MAGRPRRRIYRPLADLGPHADKMRAARVRINAGFGSELKADLEAALYGDLAALSPRALRGLVNRVDWHRRWEAFVGPLADPEQWKRARERLKDALAALPPEKQRTYTSRPEKARP